MHYVYLIRSIEYPDQLYVGHTENLRKRLSNHNAGTTPHTAKYKPWKLVMYFAFETAEKAIIFVKYLNSRPGRTFRDKRLL